MNQIRKFTDRDVRANASLYGAVVNYLMEYHGDFEFLVDCKARVEQGMDLSIGMVRGVLNCMWVDPRVTNLPQPLPAEPDEEFADVIPMAEHQRRSREKLRCVLDVPHSHSQQDFKVMEYCPGIPVVERDLGYSYRRDANIRPGFLFVKGRSVSSIRVHQAVRAEVEWYPVTNNFGWYRKPELIIHTNCQHPWSMRNPLLLTVEDVLKNSSLLERCHRCFPGEEKEEW